MNDRIQSPAPRRGLAKLLSSIAGSPAGWRSSRRGSFLVLVVGTLALLSVVAIIYATIGNQDMRTKQAVLKNEKLADVPRQFAHYIADDIIARDLWGTWYDTNTVATRPNGPPVMLRENIDYPWTDYSRNSVNPLTANAANLRAYFDPIGGVPAAAANYNANLFPTTWFPSDPWLANSEPTFLDFDQDGPTDPERPYLDNRDFPQISNVAPDGRFVNLWNLAPISGAGRAPNFDAESGVGPDPDGLPRMSMNLFLLNANGAAPAPGTLGITDYGLNLTAVHLDTPAYWTMRQRGLFRPAVPNPGTSPGLPTYLPYSYADADGDGMFDSRWMELVDSRLADGVRNLLETDGRYRYFFAVRICDLSANVNINTATDFVAAPTIQAPAGITPGDVDARRLLTMYDTYTLFTTGVGTGIRGAYDGIHQPLNDPGQALPGNYGPLGATSPPGTSFPPGDTDGGYDQPRAYTIGNFAYDVLRMAHGGGRVPPAFAFSDPTTDTPQTNLANSFLGVAPANWNFTNPLQREAFYQLKATSLADARYSFVPGGSPPVYRLNGAFNADDLGELLNRRAVNDYLLTSKLELTLEGRDNTPANASFPGAVRYGPLRSNRGPDVERRRYDPALVNFTAPNETNDFAKTQLHFASDVRQRLTTLSGARQFRTVRGITPEGLITAELKLDARSILGPLSSSRPDAQLLFLSYADALLPYSGETDSWTDDIDAETRTMFYGGRGPELAIRAAAHMAANMADLADNNFDPRLGESTAATVLIDADARGIADGDGGQFLHGWADRGKLDLGDNRLARTGSGDALQVVPGRVINVYGVEAQPFLTQVATFTVYADAPVGNGGDADHATGPNGELPEITIDGDVDSSNPDLMYRVIAFKLTNPFSTPVNLSTPDWFQNAQYFDVADQRYPQLTREYQSYHYIRIYDTDPANAYDPAAPERTSHVFKLVGLEEQVYTTVDQALQLNDQGLPALGDDTLAGDGYIQTAQAGPGLDITATGITINPQESVVCYALSLVPRAILDKVSNLDESRLDTTIGEGAYPPVPLEQLRSTIKEAIEHNLGEDAANLRTFWVPEIDQSTSPTNGRAILPLGTLQSPVRLLDIPQRPMVELWRSVRSGDEASTVDLLPATLPTDYWDDQTNRANAPNYGPIATNPNLVGNDQLVDRMRPTATTDLNARLMPGNNGVNGTTTDAEDSTKIYTITVWSSLRRPSDRESGEEAPPRGAIPGYCIEPKYSIDWNYPEDGDHDAASALTFADFTGTFRGGSDTVVGWRDSMAGGAPGASAPNRILAAQIISDSVAEIPSELKDDEGTPAAIDNATLRPNVINPTGVQFRDMYVDVALNNANFWQQVNNVSASTLRPADMLLPLGIGPEEMPYNENGAIMGDQLNDPDGTMEQRWTTLGEALALALGYQVNPDPVAPERDVTFPYWVETGTITSREQMPLDRANLWLDQYVPFYDNNQDGRFGLDGDNNGIVDFPNTTGDYARGLAIPAALNILDVFTTSPGGTEGLMRAAPGRININTTTRVVARTLPLLSPVPNHIPFAAPTVANQWWWWQDPTGVVPLAPISARTDIAATVLGYRDKSTVALRPETVADISLRFSSLLDIVQFDDLDAGGASMSPVTASTVVGAAGGRGTSTFIAGISERPGFGSVGELVAARYRDQSLITEYPCNMDYLGYDTLPQPPVPAGQTQPAPGNSSREGLTQTYETGPQFEPDELINEYKEKLTIANGVLSSVTTRSDYFVVWFVVHGYQKSDVENLGVDDPLVPSIARRFMMIVDRSKVVKQGDKAEIVLFREVPL